MSDKVATNYVLIPGVVQHSPRRYASQAERLSAFEGLAVRLLTLTDAAGVPVHLPEVHEMCNIYRQTEDALDVFQAQIDA